jgi:hypothetical protein
MPKDVPGRNGGTLKAKVKGDPPGPGRPPGPSTKTIIEKMLAAKTTLKDDETGEVEKLTAHEKLLALQVRDALNDLTTFHPELRRNAAAFLLDRLDGKPVQAVNLGGNEGQNLWTGITIEIVGGTKEPVQNEDELPDD